MSNKFVVEGGLSIPSGKFLELGGVELSASATELNLLDGMTAISTDANLGTSDTTLASQNAIKSYVDAQLGASDLDIVIGSDSYGIDLDSESITWAGTANEVDVSSSEDGSGNVTITYGLPASVDITTDLDVNTMSLATGSITDSTGAISFGDENLSTTGTLAAGVATLASSSTVGNLTLADGSVTDSSGAISFGDENLSTTGTLAAGVATLASSSTVGNLTLADGSITDSSGAISFGDENLSTTGTLGCGAITSTGSSSMATLTVSTSAILADGSQLASDAAPTADNDIANKKYVDDQLTGADLDFTSDGGESLSIDLDSETLTVAGGSNLTTSAADNTITVALDNDVTISGDMTSATITNAEFTVDASGNTDIDGTLNVEGVPTFQAQSVHSSGIDCNGTLSMGTNAIEGTADNMLIFADDSSSSGSEHSFANDDDGVLALQAVDHIRSLSDFIPNADSSVDLGSSDKRWAEVHADKMAMEHCEKRDFSVAMNGSAVEVADLTGFESGKIVLKVKDSSGNITSKEILAVNGSFVEYATITSGTEVDMTITVSGDSVRVNSANGTAKGSVDLIK